MYRPRQELTTPGKESSAAFADYDNDGFLDLIL